MMKMHSAVIISGLVVAMMCMASILLPVTANPYTDSDDTSDTENDLAYPSNYDDVMEPFGAQKRSCIRRGGNCDHRPNDCCYNSSCRCNLWGANCRCQRMGLFQKWGK